MFVNKLFSIFLLLSLSVSAQAGAPLAANFFSAGGSNNTAPCLPNINSPLGTAIPGLIMLTSNFVTTAGNVYNLRKNGAIFHVANGSSFNILSLSASNEVGAGRQGQFYATTTDFNDDTAVTGSPTYQNGATGKYGWLAKNSTDPYCEGTLYTVTGASGGSGNGTNVGYQSNIGGVSHVTVWGYVSTP